MNSKFNHLPPFFRYANTPPFPPPWATLAMLVSLTANYISRKKKS